MKIKYGDICPAGWKIPDSPNDYGLLTHFYNNTAANANSIQRALSLPFSGNFESGGVQRVGANGMYWTSTWGGSEYPNFATLVFMQSDNFWNNSIWNRWYAVSIRCVLDS